MRIPEKNFLLWVTNTDSSKMAEVIGVSEAQLRCVTNTASGMGLMLDYALHNKLKKFKKQLNNLYKNYSPLYEIEDSWDGFEWISVDERDNNVIAFRRRDKAGNQLIAIINFSGNDYHKYCLGVDEGEYKAIIKIINESSLIRRVEKLEEIVKKIPS